MKSIKALVPLALIMMFCNFEIHAQQVDVAVRTQLQDLNSRESIIFPASDKTSMFGALDVSTEIKGLRLASTIWYEKIGSRTDSEFELSEAFYDFAIEDWQISIGKKKVDWDVGYGFRPLDMFSPVDSLALYNAVAPGVWLVSADWYTDNGNISLLCNQTQPDYLQRGVQVSATVGCGGRYYHYLENWEVQGLYHYDESLRSRIGGSALRVISDALGFHASALWQQRYQTPEFDAQALTLSEFVPPVTSVWKHGAVQSLIGFNYSFEANITAILEYWYDGRSPSHRQWQSFIATLEQQQLEAVGSELARHRLLSQQEMFASQNLFRHNVMLHLRTQHPVWRPKLTMVWNPRDQGLLIDLGLWYYSLAGDNVHFGVRQYAGPDNSVYRQLEFERTVYLGAEWVF